MQQLIMNNQVIRGVPDYHDYFSAKDVLYSKTVAAGFFANRMQHLSLSAKFHTEVFLQLQYITPVHLKLYKKPEDYLDQATFVYGFWSLNRKNLLKELTKAEKLTKLTKETWKIAQATSLENDTEKIRLFCMLTAAYALAGRFPKEKGFDITSEQAERAYLGIPEPDTADTDVFSFDFSENEITLPVREQPYEIRLKRKQAVKLLEKGKEITHKKLIAGKHISGRNNVKLVLHVYGEDSTAPIQIEELDEGECRFVNVVGKHPVLVHPTPACGQTGDILCFAEQYPGSYLTLKLTESGGKIDDSKYEDNISDWLENVSAAEIKFSDECRIYLTADGIIHMKNLAPDKEKRYAAIDDYLNERKNSTNE